MSEQRQYFLVSYFKTPEFCSGRESKLGLPQSIAQPIGLTSRRNIVLSFVKSIQSIAFTQRHFQLTLDPVYSDLPICFLKPLDSENSNLDDRNFVRIAPSPPPFPSHPSPRQCLAFLAVAGVQLGANILPLQTAKAQFSKKQEPIDCALFYLAMRKKNVICGLYRFVVI